MRRTEFLKKLGAGTVAFSLVASCREEEVLPDDPIDEGSTNTDCLSTAAETEGPFPIKDPEYVDQRRKAIGLEPLSIYLKRKINYSWTIPQKE